jgi:hypothetical protein
MATTVVVAGALKGLGMTTRAAMGGAVAIEVLSTIGLLAMTHQYTKLPLHPPLHMSPWTLSLGVLLVILVYGTLHAHYSSSEGEVSNMPQSRST